jgi:TetR/AcrR family transcriptional regulator, cholesterol catabolism regulator
MLRLMLVGALNWSQTWYRAGGGATPEKIARRFVGVMKASLAPRNAQYA